MDLIEVVWSSTVLVGVGASFLVSASVGLGGSLLMVPTLTVALGAKEGVALAALLLGCNNILKIAAYWRSIPWRAAAFVVGMVSAGAFVGATAMVRAPESVVITSVLFVFVATLAIERRGWEPVRVGFAPFVALVSGATSGFSGTSGPLKGVAIRNLNLDRRHFVGAASVASLVGDLTKTSIFIDAGLLGTDAVTVAGIAVPFMVIGTWMGTTLNHRAGERGFALLFWSVMAGYSARMILALL